MDLQHKKLKRIDAPIRDSRNRLCQHPPHKCHLPEINSKHHEPLKTQVTPRWGTLNGSLNTIRDQTLLGENNEAGIKEI